MRTDLLATALRIPGITARGPARQRLRNARLVDDFFVSTVLQEAALGVVTAPGWPRHRQRLRHVLAQRLAAHQVGRLPGVELTGPPGGFLLWVRLAPASPTSSSPRGPSKRRPGLPRGRRWAVSEPDHPYLLSVAAIEVAGFPRPLPASPPSWADDTPKQSLGTSPDAA